jgi:predicted RNA polymerase sigma factor
VLAVIYLVFNEGYTATAGHDWVRPTLCEEALRLARILAELAPEEPEAHGLVALLEFQASRLSARVDPAGRPVRLNEQDRTRWDRLLIGRGLKALQRARHLRGALGPYTLQAGIAACHATAIAPADTKWEDIVALYDQLVRVTPSPIVELNRAVAVSMTSGPQAGLDLLQALDGVPALREYHLLPTVRGDFLEKLGRVEEAQVEFERAAGLAQNSRERQLLIERARACSSRSD